MPEQALGVRYNNTLAFSPTKGRILATDATVGVASHDNEGWSLYGMS
jgi:hypothetical protein